MFFLDDILSIASTIRQDIIDLTYHDASHVSVLCDGCSHLLSEYSFAARGRGLISHATAKYRKCFGVFECVKGFFDEDYSQPALSVRFSQFSGGVIVFKTVISIIYKKSKVAGC